MFHEFESMSHRNTHIHTCSHTVASMCGNQMVNYSTDHGRAVYIMLASIHIISVIFCPLLYRFLTHSLLLNSVNRNEFIITCIICDCIAQKSHTHTHKLTKVSNRKWQKNTQAYQSHNITVGQQKKVALNKMVAYTKNKIIINY